MDTGLHALAAFLGGWEVLLVLAVILVLASARWLPTSRPDAEPLRKGWSLLREQLVLWVAQGFGTGRIPFAPGTFGSLVGLLWFLVLLRTGDLRLCGVGILFGLALSVWLCGAAERILNQTDPPSVVLDEIAAVPLCFAPWVVAHGLRQGSLPAPESFFTPHTWLPTLIVFVLFRLFDILKPWPIRQSQRWPGGWGVTVDDVLAAVYVAAVSLIFVV